MVDQDESLSKIPLSRRVVDAGVAALLFGYVATTAFKKGRRWLFSRHSLSNILTTPSLKSCFVFEIVAYPAHCFSNGLEIAVL
ncbi:MAG TPA: hypothetical protein VFF28_07175 [Candidatus Nanoarchaeia archaeon]|nr:hypothetical protein [Candidatus Nanoarchaeia archaeon]